MKFIALKQTRSPFLTSKSSVYGVLVSLFPTHKRSGILDAFVFFR